MDLALSPTALHALTIHTQQLMTFLLSGDLVLRGRVTAWLLEAGELLQQPEDRADQETRLAVLLGATLPGRRRPAKVRRIEKRVDKRRRHGAR